MVLGIALFWVGVFTAGALADGYSAREDFISSLAGRGSEVAPIGIAALLANAVAHLAAAAAVLRRWKSRLCAILLACAGAAVVVIAVARVSCPGGPAGCGEEGGARSDVLDLIHGLAVGTYEIFILAAMGAVAVTVWRRAQAGRPRWLAPLSLVFAVASVVLLARTGDQDPGLWQRLWVASNLTWLLLVAWLATRGRPRAVRAT